MYQLALTLSIISSILFIIYLLIVIFKKPEPQDNTITITGSFTTRTVYEPVNITRIIDIK
jgi:hypothetical protein